MKKNKRTNIHLCWMLIEPLTHKKPGEGGGRYSHKNWVGVCDLFPKTFTPVFMTKNVRFSQPYLWPDQNFDTLFMTWLLDHYPGWDLSCNYFPSSNKC